MKHLITALLILSSFNTFAADNFKAYVEEAFCGEMDPYVVGDVCLVSIVKEESGDKITMLLDFDTFAHDVSEIEGELIEVNPNRLRKIYNREVLEILLSFGRDYYYMNAEDDAFEIVENPSNYEMKKFISKLPSYFHIRNMPEGYTAKKIETPRLKSNFKAYLKGAASVKEMDWSEFVYQSGEYEHLPSSEMRRVSENPWKELGVKYLLEVSKVYEIYKNGRKIGYFMMVVDHVQSAIYQDGAWMDMLLDLDMNVLKSTNDSA